MGPARRENLYHFDQPQHTGSQQNHKRPCNRKNTRYPGAEAAFSGGYSEPDGAVGRKMEKCGMIKLLIHSVLTALVLLILAQFVPGFQGHGWQPALVAALVIGLLNWTLGLLLKIVTFFITILTLGLFLLVINALMILLAFSCQLRRNTPRGAGPFPYGSRCPSDIQKRGSEAGLLPLHTLQTTMVPCQKEDTMHTHRIFRILALSAGFVLLATGIASSRNQNQYDDPGQLGRFAVGHTSYLFNDAGNGNRPVAVSIFYPVDAQDVRRTTPRAQYLTDSYTSLVPPTPGWLFAAQTPPSRDGEGLGYDRAYERPSPSREGPFPLVMVSPGLSFGNWYYIFIGTRLASHGYVVAVLEHWADGEWPWSPSDDLIPIVFNRPRDVSFAITQLLSKSKTPGEFLFRTIDPQRIAASGHSFGGYATYTLAGGDDMVCDALLPAEWGAESYPYPASTCVPTPPDLRIKAMISMDGASYLLRFRELARISVPSLIMGETVDDSETNGGPALRDWNARPHAAIDRDDSYRVDVNGTNHYSFTDYCDGMQIWFNKGWISADSLNYVQTTWPCTNVASPGDPPVTISSLDEHLVVTKYMIALLDSYFGGPYKNQQLDRWILTPGYAVYHRPTVQFFVGSEHCNAALPDHSYFTYRAYQLSSECDVAQKDPTGWFAPEP